MTPEARGTLLVFAAQQRPGCRAHRGLIRGGRSADALTCRDDDHSFGLGLVLAGGEWAMARRRPALRLMMPSHGAMAQAAVGGARGRFADLAGRYTEG